MKNDRNIFFKMLSTIQFHIVCCLVFLSNIREKIAIFNILTSCGKNGACRLTQMALQKSASPMIINVDHWRFVKFFSILNMMMMFWKLFRILICYDRHFVSISFFFLLFISRQMSLIKWTKQLIILTHVCDADENVRFDSFLQRSFQHSLGHTKFNWLISLFFYYSLYFRTQTNWKWLRILGQFMDVVIFLFVFVPFHGCINGLLLIFIITFNDGKYKKKNRMKEHPSVLLRWIGFLI